MIITRIIINIVVIIIIIMTIIIVVVINVHYIYYIYTTLNCNNSYRLIYWSITFS